MRVHIHEQIRWHHRAGLVAYKISSHIKIEGEQEHVCGDSFESNYPRHRISRLVFAPSHTTSNMARLTSRTPRSLANIHPFRQSHWLAFPRWAWPNAADWRGKCRTQELPLCKIAFTFIAAQKSPSTEVVIRWCNSRKSPRCPCFHLRLILCAFELLSHNHASAASAMSINNIILYHTCRRDCLLWHHK